MPTPLSPIKSRMTGVQVASTVIQTTYYDAALVRDHNILTAPPATHYYELVALVGYSTSSQDGYVTVVECMYNDGTQAYGSPLYTHAKFPVPAGATFSLDSPLRFNTPTTRAVVGADSPTAGYIHQVRLLFDTADAAGSIGYTLDLRKVAYSI